MVGAVCWTSAATAVVAAMPGSVAAGQLPAACCQFNHCATISLAAGGVLVGEPQEDREWWVLVVLPCAAGQWTTCAGTTQQAVEGSGSCIHMCWQFPRVSTWQSCRPPLNRLSALPNAGGATAGLQLMKRVASAGMLLAPFPLGKRPCLEYMHLAAAAHHDQLLHHPPGPLHPGSFPAAGGGTAGAGPNGGPYFATPEIVPVPLLAGGGSGHLPPLRREGAAAGTPMFEELPQHNGNATVHGSGGYMQQLAGNSEVELFGELFPGGGDAGTAAGRGSQSPRDQLPGRRDGSGVLPPLAGGPAANGGGFYQPQSPHDRREGSAENKEVGGRARG